MGQNISHNNINSAISNNTEQLDAVITGDVPPLEVVTDTYTDIDINTDPLIDAIKKKYSNKKKSQEVDWKESCDSDEIMRMVIDNGLNIQFVENQSFDLCRLAIQENIYSYVYIKNHDMRKQLRRVLLSVDGMLLEFIDEQTEELCIRAVKNNALALQFVKPEFIELNVKNHYPSYAQINKLWQAALIRDVSALQFIPNQTVEVYDYLFYALNNDWCNVVDTDNPNTRIYFKRKYFSDIEIGKLLKYVNNQTETICKKFIVISPKSLMYIKNQTDFLCDLAVNIDGLTLEYVKNKTPKLCEDAVKRNPLALQYVDNQTDQMCEKAVEQNPLAFQYVKNKTDKLSEIAVKYNGLMLEFVNEQTEKICTIAVAENPLALKFVKNQTENICINALKKINFHIAKELCSCTGDFDKFVKTNENDMTKNENELMNLLKYVKVQTSAICKTALKFRGMMLQYVKNQTLELCETAVNQDGLSLQYVNSEFKTNHIYKTAIQSNPVSLKFIDNQTEELCIDALNSSNDKNIHIVFQMIKNKTPNINKLAVEKNGLLLEYITDQTDELCLIAVKQNGMALRFVHVQTYYIQFSAVYQNGAALIYTNPYNKNKDPYSSDIVLTPQNYYSDPKNQQLGTYTIGSGYVS